MPEPWADFKEVFRTRDCADGTHAECSHFFGMGGGFNLRRLRPEFGVRLCTCSCHSSCPVMITGKRLSVPVKTWYESCTCPGAEQARRSMDEAGIEIPDHDAIRRNGRARKAAFDAARARASGKDRDDVRDIYVEELRARDLSVPAEPVLDGIAESITGSHLDHVRLLGKALSEMGKGLYDIYRLHRQTTGGQDPGQQRSTGPD
jgi:hypothetical protein